MSDLVSIITASFNSSDFIQEMIKSVQCQTYENWELLITDDNSCDNSVIIAEEMASKDSRIKVFRLKANSGAAVARNNSIYHAQGDYIAFLDSDDTWECQKLERQLDFFRQNIHCPLIYSGFNIIDTSSTFIKKQSVPSRVTYEDLLKSCSIGCLTAMINVRVTGKMYMPLLKRRQDFALWLQILRTYKYALAINEPLANYRVGNSSISSNKLKVIKYQWKTYYNVEKLGFLRSLYYMVHWALRGINKYYLNVSKD